MINIVIPMAGAGSRFANAGYEIPKPFIDVNGAPMIVGVLDNLKCKDSRYILIARKEHLEKKKEIVRYIENEYDAVFVPIEQLTEGTACTVLFARKYINNENALLIANSDQIIDVGIDEFVDDCYSRGLDGSILTFVDKEKDPKWSFARTDDAGLVVEVKEKEAISDLATVGIYLYAHGKDFVNASIDMIARNERVKGEFYTCPTYNYAIKDGKKIGVFNIDFSAMHGIGTPDDLQEYLNLINSK